jgi:hypothetical protein
MTSAVDPRKLKSLLKDSQASIPEDETEDEEQTVDETGDDESDEDEGGEGEEVTVDSLAKDLQPAVATLNELVDEFRANSGGDVYAGVEQLEEDEEIDSSVVHAFCDWTVEAGRKDFRKLGEALDVEDVDGFVGWCRAVRKMEEDGEGEGDGGDEDEGEDGQDDGPSGRVEDEQGDEGGDDGGDGGQ